MILASKITFAILFVGLVALLAVTTMNSNTPFSRSLTMVDESKPEGAVNSGSAEGDAESQEKPMLGLRAGHEEIAAESVKELLKPENSDVSSMVDESSDHGKERGNRVKGSHRGLWYSSWYSYPAPAPKPYYYRPAPAPKYYYPKYPAPKYYYPKYPAPKYYAPRPAPKYQPYYCSW